MTSLSKTTSQSQSLSLIYLDANATTPVLPQAAAAALSTMETAFGNPSSSHISGLQAKQIVDKTRQQAKDIVGAAQGNIIFTSGATEGIQTAILSALLHIKKTHIKKANAKKVQAKKALATTPNLANNYCLLYGATEHKAVPESLKHWNEILEINAEIKAIPVNAMGQLDLDFIAKEVPNALMICTMAVNNETGVYQDIALLEKTIRSHNPDVPWMVDCVQALGKTKLNLAQTSIDYAPFSGHKLYAPKGIGFIYVKENAPFTAFIAGGGQESGLRSGTENLPGLAALSVIFSMLLNEIESSFSPIATLQMFRQQIVSSLSQAFPDIVFNHRFENSVATTLNFSIPGFSSKEIMDLFDAANVRVSSGSACSAKVTRSFVLDAMGLPAWQSESAIRMSFGPAITQAEVDITCSRIVLAAQALLQNCLTTDINDSSINTNINTNINNKINNKVNVDKTKLDGLVQFKVAGCCSWLYIDNNTQSALVIDLLPEVTKRLQTLLACQGLNLVAVLDTNTHHHTHHHAHHHDESNHESDRKSMAKKYLAKQPSDALGWPIDTQTTNIHGQQYPYIIIGDKWLVKVASLADSDDSMSLLLCDPITDPAGELTVHYAFCGDLISMDSLGRTNFSTSCAPAMYSSLKLVKLLIGNDSLICPSHDYNNQFTTSIASEMTRKEITVGEYNSASLTKAIKESSNIKLIDIREPHEYALQHDKKFTHNVPLTRLVQFVQEHQQHKEQELVLVCRSGGRSQLAAQALSRLGFAKVSHLTGGYALHQY